MVGTEVASLYATMGADISKFQRSMGTVDDLLHSAGGKLGGFVNTLGTGLVVAGTAAAAGLAAAGAGIINVTNKAASAQQAVADIAANMQLNAEETQKVAKLVNDLGIDPKLKVTAGEAAAAIDMLGKNGQSLTQIFGGSARATILLANSTKADFATAADIATDVMLQFNIAAENMMTAVNGITGTTQYSKFSINDYKLALAQAGGVASSVGVNFEDFNATIAAISPLFAGGSDAGTSFKTFLQRLTPSTKPAIKAMKELGIITADGKNQFYDATGNMKSMAEVAGILKTAFGGLSDEQKNQYASTIFGTDAMRAAFALANAGAETINKLKTQIGNTDAEKAASTRMNTLKGDYEIFTGVIDALSIRIGEKFIPAAREMVQWLTTLASDHADQIVGFFSGLVDYIPKVSDALTWVNQKWSELTTFLQPVTDSVGRFIENIKLLWIGLNENNVGIFASGIRGLMFEFQRGLTWVMDYISTVNWSEVLSTWRDAFITWGGAVWNNVYPYLNAMWSSLTSWVTDSGRRQQLLGALTGAWNWISTWAGSLWTGTLYPMLSSMWQSLISWATDAGKRQQLTDAISATWDGFKNWAKTLWETNIRPYLVTGAANLKLWIDSNYPQFGTWIDSVTKFATEAKNQFAANLPIMGQKVSELRSTVESEVPKIGAAMDRLWKNLFGEGDGSGTTFANRITAFFSTITGAISTIISQFRIMLDVLNIMIEATKAVFAGDFQGYWNKRNEFNKAWEEFQNVTSNQWSTFANMFGGRAGGGRVTAGGLTVVGERGPELVDLPGGSYVHNNVESVGMLGGSSSRLDVYIHANGTMPTDRAAIRQLAIELQREMGMNGGRVVFG